MLLRPRAARTALAELRVVAGRLQQQQQQRAAAHTASCCSSWHHYSHQPHRSVSSLSIAAFRSRNSAASRQPHLAQLFSSATSAAAAAPAATAIVPSSPAMATTNKPSDIHQHQKHPRRVEAVRELYGALSSQASYSAATLSPLPGANANNQQRVVVNFSFGVLEPHRDLRRRLSAQVLVDVAAGSVLALSTASAADLSDSTIIEARHPDGERVVSLRTESNPKASGGKKKLFVEIWRNLQPIKSIEVTDLHGDFVNEDFFASVSWSANGKHIAYVAERRQPETKDLGPLEKFAAKEDWGEKYTKRPNPTIVVVDVLSGKVKVLDSIMDSPGQVIFNQNDDGLVFTAVETFPRQYGLKFCVNRKTHVCSIDLDGENQKKISNGLVGARSPLMVPSKNQLVDLETNESNVLVDIPTEYGGSRDFTGLYINNLVKDSFVFEGEWIITSSAQRSRRPLYAVHTQTGKVIDLTPESDAAWTLLFAQNHLIVASRSDPNHPQELLLGVLKKEDQTLAVDRWISVHGGHKSSASQSLSQLEWFVHTSKQSSSLEAIVLRPIRGNARSITLPKEVDKTAKPSPVARLINFAASAKESAAEVEEGEVVSSDDVGAVRNNQKLPLIVVPHGGPHSAFAGDYSAYLATLAFLGYSIAMVNYTGSTGFGEESIRKLLGKIGDLDVFEVQQITEDLLATGDYDRERVYVFGGSHGGFLGAHLTAQYSDFYRAAILRNPVINVASNYAASDIPDWSFSEAGIDYDLSHPPLITPDAYAKMYHASPIAKVDGVKTPTLLMLGDQDRRVPNYQGYEWYYALRHRGVDVRLLTFSETGHALDSVEAERGGIEAIAAFLGEFS